MARMTTRRCWPAATGHTVTATSSADSKCTPGERPRLTGGARGARLAQRPQPGTPRAGPRTSSLGVGRLSLPHASRARHGLGVPGGGAVDGPVELEPVSGADRADVDG